MDVPMPLETLYIEMEWRESNGRENMTNDCQEKQEITLKHGNRQIATKLF
jgi:hypothetical protein